MLATVSTRQVTTFNGRAEGGAGDVTDQGDVVVEDYWMEIFHIE